MDKLNLPKLIGQLKHARRASFSAFNSHDPVCIQSCLQDCFAILFKTEVDLEAYWKDLQAEQQISETTMPV